MRAPQSWYTEVLRAGDPQWSATTEEIDAAIATRQPVCAASGAVSEIVSIDPTFSAAV